MKFTRLAVSVAVAALALPAFAQSAPQYSITDLGSVNPTNYSQAWGVSPNGTYVAGRMIADDYVNAVPWPAFQWQAGQGITAQGYLAGHNYNWGYAVNNSGVSVGVAATGEDGSGAVPVMWSNGQATALAMPGGNTVGRAYAVNSSGIAVGSAGYDVNEQGAIYNTVTGKSTLISAFSNDGSYMQSAFGISDNGMIVGSGIGPSGTNDVVLYNMNTNVMTTLAMPAYVGVNSSLGEGISDNGMYVVGSNGNDSQGFIWSAATGAIAINLPAGSSQGSLKSVNDSGWAVGESATQYAVPILYENGTTYTLSDLITNINGWNFTTTTSANAVGIDDNGDIVGTAQINGVEHAFLLTPVPEPTSYALLLSGLIVVAGVTRRRRVHSH